MSSCYCDYDEPKFYFNKLVKARKQHKCDECRNIIQKGETYERVSAMWDDYAPDTYRTCSKCLDLRNYTKQNVPCVCWCHTTMRDDCMEALKEYSHELPGLLFRGYRLLLKTKSKNR